MPRIEALTREHDRSDFDCGVAELNAYLKSMARQHGDKGVSRSFVLTDIDSPAILGFFTLALCEVVADKLPAGFVKKIPPTQPPGRSASTLSSLSKTAGEKIWRTSAF